MEDARKSPRCGLLVREAVVATSSTRQSSLGALAPPGGDLANRARSCLPFDRDPEQDHGGDGRDDGRLDDAAERGGPGAGNVAISELRADYEQLTPGERLEQAAELSKVATELAMGAET